MKRFASIDVLRAAAILLMVQVHFVENLAPREAASAVLYDISAILGILPAPFFTFLMGLSLWLWLHKRESSKKLAAGTTGVILRRGFFIFVAGLVFACLVWTPWEVFHWDILTLIGASTLILYALRKVPPWALAVLCLLAVVVSPALRDLTGYAAHWNGEEYSHRFTIAEIVQGFLFHGYFPLLPWIVFPLAGFATGRLFVGDRRARGDSGSQRRRLMPVIGGGLLLLSGASLVLQESGWLVSKEYVTDITFYPASTAYLLGTMGLIFLSLWALNRWLDERPVAPQGPVLAFFNRYSRFSLTMYIVHHAVHIWPLYLAAIVAGRNDLWWYYEDALSAPMALLLAVAFVAIFYVVLIFWERRGARYSFESVLRRFSGA